MMTPKLPRIPKLPPLPPLKDLEQSARDTANKAAAQATMIATLARDTANEKAQHFMAYIESKAFEQDLDELGARLEIPAEKLAPPAARGEKHWDRVTHKAAVLAKHAALETVTGTTHPQALTALLPWIRSRKTLRWVAGLSAGATLLKIGYHCYQVFVARKENEPKAARPARST